MSIERKNSGDKLKIAASDWNELARTADAVEELRNRQGSRGGARLRLDPTSVWVQNNSGEILPPGSIVGLASLAIDLAVGEWPVFAAGLPGGDGRIGILLDALPAGTTTLARCAVSGVVRTVVNVSDAGHGFAVPNGTYDSLESVPAGIIRILWAEGVGDGQDALVRIEAGVGEDDMPDIRRVVTNVCPTTKPAPPIVYRMDTAVVVDGDGQELIKGTVSIPKGPVKFKASVGWSDPDWEASTFDEYETSLYIGDTKLEAKPTHLVIMGGPSAATTVEYEWVYNNLTQRPVAFMLLGQRTTGYGKLTATTATKLEVTLPAGSIIVEYQQEIAPRGTKRGKKVCVVDPKDCCLEDESSFTSSLLQVPCCPVPVPSQWTTTITHFAPPLAGWEQTLYSSTQVNYDALKVALKAAIEDTHVLTFKGVQNSTYPVPRDGIIECVFEKILHIDSPYYLRRQNGFSPAETVPIVDYVQPSLVFKLRFNPESERWLSRWYGPDAGERELTPEIAAVAMLEVSTNTAINDGVFGQFSADFGARFSPHHTEDYYVNRLYGPDSAELQTLRNLQAAGTWPEPGTACDGPCRLWSPEYRHSYSYETSPAIGDTVQLFITVEPVT